MGNASLTIRYIRAKVSDQGMADIFYGKITLKRKILAEPPPVYTGRKTAHRRE